MKKGAMELSIGTIVIIVLAMSMLILGLILVKNIFSGATDITDMTNEQVKNQIKNLFGHEEKVAIYPDSRQLTLKQGELGAFGIGIRNDDNMDHYYDYHVTIASEADLSRLCKKSIEDTRNWFQTGQSEKGVVVAPGQFEGRKVTLNVPKGSTLCTFRLKIDVKYGQGDPNMGSIYQSDFIDITIKS